MNSPLFPSVRRNSPRFGGGSFLSPKSLRRSRGMNSVSEDLSLIFAAVVAVITIFITRPVWFPASFVESLIPKPAPPPEHHCHFPVGLNAQGALEGPWLNATWQKLDVAERGALKPTELVDQGKLIALTAGGDDGTLKPEHLLEGIEALPVGDNTTHLAFARLAERYLSTWSRIDGVTEGLGKRGLIKNVSLYSMARNKKLAPCAAHVRISGGRVYFRYGSFLQIQKQLQRINLMIRAIQEAVTKFNLLALKAELFLNACDAPQSFDNSLSSGRSGFAVFSTQLTPGSTDILCPDPLDLLNVAVWGGEVPTPWAQRAPKAVWRGEGFEFDLRLTNWASSFRLRLHNMASARPDLLDARVTAWGPKDKETAKAALTKHGFALGQAMPVAQRQAGFRHRLVVDDRVGTREMCAGLSGDQGVVRHTSGFMEWFDPLLLPGVHYVPVRHSLANLFESIEWMNAHNDSVKEMIRNANEMSKGVCTHDAQVHFWAILLSKYSNRAMEQPEVVQVPKVCEGGQAITTARWADAKTPPTCKLPSGGPCTDFCVDGKIESEWTWLDARAVSDVAKLLTS